MNPYRTCAELIIQKLREFQDDEIGDMVDMVPDKDTLLAMEDAIAKIIEKNIRPTENKEFIGHG